MNDPVSWIETLGKLSDISLQHRDKSNALQQAVEYVCAAMGSRVCTVALVNLAEDHLVQVACAGCNAGFVQQRHGRKFRLGAPGVDAWLDRGLVAAGEVIEKYGLQRDGQGVARPEVAQKHGLDRLLACPLKSEGRLIGYLNHFDARSGPFTAEEKQRLDIFARHIAITIERLESFAARHQLKRLNDLMQQMAEARTVDDLWSLIMQAGMELGRAPRGAVCRLDVRRDELIIEKYKGPELRQLRLRTGQGITNKALIEGRPVRCDDVTHPDWKGIYADLWLDTRSELAIPIVLSNAAVRVRTQVERAPKPIGVLNLESPDVAAFSQADADLLWSLARYGAVLIDRLDADRKQAELARAQQAIVGKQDWNDIIQAMMEAIKETLGYDYVNFSLVKPDIGRIKTEYIIGIPEKDVEEFKRLADHPLDSNDIQAHVVRTRQIEVPDQRDDRFDPVIYDRFGHERMLRVYVPMIAPADNRVMGTVEAGYQRSNHRAYIYEQDVQILKGFIDYAARALERRQSWLLEKIGHELRSPVVGIRNNASFMQRRGSELGFELIDRKCGDILTDCDILLSQIAQLEYILGKTPPPPKIERTLLFRDVIIKTIRQLRPLVSEQGFDIAQVEYSTADMYKIRPLYVDRARIGQVFYNLLTNSIKYAQNDPTAFSIRISVEDKRDYWIVKVQDNGIGVRREYAERIFEEGFRTPEAIAKNATGSGLGLTIARQIIRDMGGDLKLTQFANPTEFQIWLPKKLTEAPNDSAH